VIRKEAWPFYRTISGVRLCWELEEPKGPKKRAGGAADPVGDVLGRGEKTFSLPLIASRLMLGTFAGLLGVILYLLYYS